MQFIDVLVQIWECIMPGVSNFDQPFDSCNRIKQYQCDTMHYALCRV